MNNSRRLIYLRDACTGEASERSIMRNHFRRSTCRSIKFISLKVVGGRAPSFYFDGDIDFDWKINTKLLLIFHCFDWFSKEAAYELKMGHLLFNELMWMRGDVCIQIK